MLRVERWQALSAEQRRGLPFLFPDLVIKQTSPSDQGPRGVEKGPQSGSIDVCGLELDTGGRQS